MEKNITELFLNRISDLYSNGFTDKDLHQAKRCVLDYIGVTLAGARINGKGEKLLDLFSDTGDYIVVGGKNRTSLQNAAFLNGINSHIAELDDGIISGIVHPGAPVISTLLPFAQKYNVGGLDFLHGVIVGYEVAARIANSIQPSHRKRGYHATGTCGCIAAATGVAAMLKVDENKLRNIFSTAIVSSHGSLKVLDYSSELKPFNVGQAALNATYSVVMGLAGFNGPSDVLAGETGFFSMMTNEFFSDELFKGSNSLAVHDVYVKPYAACRFCHPVIDVILAMRNQFNFDVGKINEIEIFVAQPTMVNHDFTIIDGVSSAKMSIPYSAAVSLVTGSAGVDEFSQSTIQRIEESQLMGKIRLYSKDEFSKQFPEKLPASVRISTVDSKIYELAVSNPRGDSTTPLSDTQLEQKMLELGKFATYPDKICKEIAKSVWDIENRMEELFLHL